MKSFSCVSLDIQQALADLAAFKTLLDSHQQLSEQAQLLPFFQQHSQLCALMGQLHPSVVIPDKMAWEYDLFGDFTADFAIGDSYNHAYCFIEFEDGKTNSIFKQTHRASADWASRFEHGFSQIVDWIYKLDDMKNTDIFADRFQQRNIDFMGVLVIGRRQALTPTEQRRLKWREKFVLINSQRIRCLTFDDLYDDMALRLSVYPAATLC